MTVTQSPPQHRCRQRLIAVAAVLLWPLVGAAAAAGELKVTGQQDALVIEAKDVPIQDVLAALNRSINLQYRVPASMSRTILGRYEGSLQRVLASMLQGTDYILRSAPEGSTLTIIARTTDAPMRGSRGGIISADAPEVRAVPRNPEAAAAPPARPPAVQGEEPPMLAPASRRPPPPTYPNEGMNYPAGTDFGKGL